jgi:stage III sporulation protein SpoIIIAA
MVRKLQPAADGQITPQMVEAMKQIVFTMTSESVFTVEDGMTRGIVENSTIEVSLAGHTFTKAEKKTVAVTPLPRL